MIHTFQTETSLNWPIADVFTFFSDAANIEKITPPELCFGIVTTCPIEMSEQTYIDYRLRLYGIPFKWSTLIAVWNPPNQFVDIQEKGPFKKWVHAHIFSEQKGSTKMRDKVIYQLPFWSVYACGQNFFPPWI